MKRVLNTSSQADKGQNFSLLVNPLHINTFPNKAWFLHVYSTSLLKTLPFSSNLKLSCANSLSLEESKICCLGKG